ncbi:MAG: hypothetical protein AAF718_18350, partial [Pseudomonadota bacterium]
MGGFRAVKRQGGAGAIHHHEGHQASDIAPALPAVELPEIVRSHDPDKIDGWVELRNEAQRIGRVAGGHVDLAGADFHARIGGDVLTGLHTVCQRREVSRVFERISR